MSLPIRGGDKSGGGGAAALPPPVGRVIDHATSFGGTITTLALAANTLYASPIFLTHPTTISAVQFAVSTASTAGGVGRVGLWSADPVNPFVLTRLDDLGTVLVDTTGNKSISIARSYPAGTLLIGTLTCDLATTVRALSGVRNLYGNADANEIAVRSGASLTAVTGAHPATLTLNGTNSFAVRISLLVA